MRNPEMIKKVRTPRSACRHKALKANEWGPTLIACPARTSAIEIARRPSSEGMSSLWTASPVVLMTHPILTQSQGLGFSPCGLRKAPAAKAIGYRCVAARLKPVP
jgi:hypothetical protein